MQNSSVLFTPSFGKSLVLMCTYFGVGFYLGMAFISVNTVTMISMIFSKRKTLHKYLMEIFCEKISDPGP